MQAWYKENEARTRMGSMKRSGFQKTRRMMKGYYFEELNEGMVVEHPLRRTVTEMDNTLFSCLTHNPQPLHIDRHYCETQTEFGQPLMNSLFTLGLMIGISVNDTTLGTTIANLGMTDVKFPHPLFHGDTVHIRTTVLGKRESKSRPTAGIVTFRHEAFNQDDKLVAECTRQAFMHKRPVQS
jgi:acyl dehydratase